MLREMTDDLGVGEVPQYTAESGRIFNKHHMERIVLCTYSRVSNFTNLYCKKRLAVFPSPAGMSITKLSLAGNK